MERVRIGDLRHGAGGEAFVRELSGPTPICGCGVGYPILLDQVADDALDSHLREARRIIAPDRVLYWSLELGGCAAPEPATTSWTKAP